LGFAEADRYGRFDEAARLTRGNEIGQRFPNSAGFGEQAVIDGGEPGLRDQAASFVVHDFKSSE
jgi:hypothetical protein